MPVTIEHINVSYPLSPQRYALQDISFELLDGTCTLLVGQTGSGKSTLLDAISGLIPLQSGRVVLDGAAIWANSVQESKSARMRMGHVFQSPDQQLFAQTVKKEFAYSMRPYRLDAESVLERTHSSLDTFELGRDLLSRSPLMLSGGQKRRVAVASTDATCPDWLLLDEPTAGLDSASLVHLTTWLQQWKGRVRGGVVIATHDIDALLPYADTVILMKAGRIQEIVTADDLAANPFKLHIIGISLPQRLQMIHALGQIGVPLAEIKSAQSINAPDVANAVLEWKESVPAGNFAVFLSLKEPLLSSESWSEEVAIDEAAETYRPIATDNGFWRLDARAKWIGSFLLCLALLLQPHGWQTFVGLAVALGTVFIARLPLPRLWSVTKPILILAMISILFSSLTVRPFSHLPFHLALSKNEAITAFYGFLQIYAAMMIGLLLPATTSQMAIKEALAQILKPLSRLKFPVEAIALTASLTLRFIPLILRQFQRFRKISQSRGKRQVRPGKIAWRDFPATLIPLILSLLQHGEDVSVAMEARGYTVREVPLSTKFGGPGWTSLTVRDWVWIITATVLSCALVALRYWS